MVVPFDEYDFDNDERYAAYMKNVELGGAPQDQEALLRRLQAKWYQKNVIQDPEFVPIPQQKTPEAAPRQPETPSASAPSTDPARSDQPQAPPAQATGGPAPTPDASRKSMMTGLNAIVQAGMLVLGFVLLVSYLMQNHGLILTMYRVFLQAALTSHVLRLVATVGYPTLWPFNWPELQQWMARISGTSDAHYAAVCFMFAAHQPTLLVVASPAILASLRLAAYLRKNFSRVLWGLMPLCDKISSQRELAFYGMAVMDLSLLGVVIGRAVTSRSIILPFVYLNMLRHRYSSPVSAKYHQAIWSVLVGYAKPVMKYMPSPVHTGVGYLTRWFTGRTV